jgi:holo-[acyl-carrier protein] synthase
VSDADVGVVAPPAGVVVGVGIDLVDLSRLRSVLARRSRLAERILAPSERLGDDVSDQRRLEWLGGRFAAKEAAMKSLGIGVGGCGWWELPVVRLPSGAPDLRPEGRALERCRALGVSRLLCSITHTAESASALVVAVRDVP